MRRPASIPKARNRRRATSQRPSISLCATPTMFWNAEEPVVKVRYARLNGVCTSSMTCAAVGPAIPLSKSVRRGISASDGAVDKVSASSSKRSRSSDMDGSSCFMRRPAGIWKRPRRALSQAAQSPPAAPSRPPRSAPNAPRPHGPSVSSSLLTLRPRTSATCAITAARIASIEPTISSTPPRR